MAYLNTHTRTASATGNDEFKAMGRLPSNFGVFLGYVKNVADVQKNGRLQVWIPEFGSTPDNELGWITVSYCSPFAGATNQETTSVTDFKSFDATQTSYGMWFVPPDINNQVLVMFINGDTSRGIWIGSLFNQYMNTMVPAMAASTSNHQYPDKFIPVAEYNKHNKTVTDPEKTIKPYQATKFKGVGNQGLINDQQRGVTSSSARREAPSNVFGIITPGPIIKNDLPKNIRRKGGSSFIMDDGTGTEYVKLSTKSGAQITLDETNGFVYLINRDGTAWVEMDQHGNIDIFGAKNISMRAQRDFNIRADRNINIEAGQNIFMKAAKDTKETTTTFTYDVNNVPKPTTIPQWEYVGEGKGQGGNIVFQALENWQSTIEKGVFLSVKQNNLDVRVNNTVNVTTVNGSQNYASKQGIKMTTDGAFDLAATGNIRAGSKGSVNVVGLNNIVLCTDNNISLNAAGNIIETAVNNISLNGTSVNIGTNLNVSGLTSSTEMKSDTFVYHQQQIGGGSPTPATTLNPAAAEAAMSASTARPAEVKPLNEKLNILATWKHYYDQIEWSPNTFYHTGNIVRYKGHRYVANKEIAPAEVFKLADWDTYIEEDKFRRNTQPVFTTVSRYPTYEPCPEHENFKTSSVASAKPVLTPDDDTYKGSAGAGNDATTPPAATANPGASNTSVKGDPVTSSIVSKDVNTVALRKQLIIHEGYKNRSYADSLNLTTGGIGHLLRSNELAMYPIGTPISDDQIETWYSQDSTTALKIAQDLVITVWDELSDVRKRAMADLAYNLGKPRLAKFNNFLRAMNAKNFDKAGEELRNSAWFNQVGKRGPNIITMIVKNIDPTGSDRA